MMSMALSLLALFGSMAADRRNCLALPVIFHSFLELHAWTWSLRLA
jgi:hypothetical protein